jgi:hypothetical protein
MKPVPFAALVALALAPALVAQIWVAPARAGQRPRQPFTATLSNNTPLAIGMSADDAAAALGSPLGYISGRPGDEILVAVRTNGGSGFFPRKDRLYLQFRKSRLAGWKGDWGHNWMWQ